MTQAGSGSSSNSTSRSLLVRLRDGDAEAWDRLVELYAPTVCQWCRKMRLRDHEISDIVQEVFHTVALRLHQFRKEKASDSFRAWLRVVTRSKVVDYLRKAGKQAIAPGGTEAQTRLAQLPAIEPGECDREERQIESDLLRRAMLIIQGSFHEQTWRAFWMVTVDGRPTRDVADELGLSPGAVRVAKSRVLTRLRHELGDVE